MGHSGYIFRICAIAFVAVAGLLGLSVRLYYVQIVRHDELYDKAKRKYTSVKTSRGARGDIYDVSGNLLVGSIPCKDIRANPQDIDSDALAREMARFFAKRLETSEGDLYRRMSHKKRGDKLIQEVVLQNAVSFDLANRLIAETKERGYPGLIFYDSSKRYYPKNELLSNVLGFVNGDNIDVVPVTGIESAYNDVLEPVEVKASVFERDRRGCPFSYGFNRFYEAKPGRNVYLTISEPIQTLLEEELDKLMTKWTPRAAYAVMADPKTGSILAMAQRPTFNPNDRGPDQMAPDRWRDRIITEGFEPGSSMKPLVIAGALDAGIVSPHTRFDCERGHWFYGGKILRDSHPLDVLTVREIIQKSSNIGTAKISVAYGAPRLFNLFCRYGFGENTGIPLRPEATGIFRKLSKWDTLSITRFPIGQGILVSPLQLTRAYCALANEGKRPRLRLVDRIEDPVTKQVFQVPVTIEDRVVKDPESIRKTVEMMKMVTRVGGTATEAAIPGYDVAGKTGTSQKWVDGGYSHEKFFATFIGFVPADAPAFVLLVTVDEPKGAHYGGTIAAPAFREIASKTLRYMDIPPAPEEEPFRLADAKGAE